MKLTKTYILTLMVMLLCSCADDVLVDTIGGQQAKSVAISFDQGYVDKNTRSAVALSDYQQTMGVWGYRNPADDNERVFNNQQIQFDATEGWNYSPLKYWETTSLYDFYAYSPYDNENVKINTSASRAYLINIYNIALTGVNLQETPSAAEKMIFNGTADTDWMIARKAETNISGAARRTVQFNMQHVLAKLNVRMRLSATMASILGTDYVTIDKMTIGQLNCKGDFAQQLTATPSTDDEKTSSAAEWTLTNDQISLQRTQPCTLTSDNLYLMESLVMPQALDDADNINMEYTIHYADHTEKFKYSKLLRDISADLQHLYTGYNYTVTFVLDPDKITFTANAANWDDQASGKITVE